MRAIYAQGPPQPRQGFDEYVRGLQAARPATPPEPATSRKAVSLERWAPPPMPGQTPARVVIAREYAGWQNTGHARMFRPYKFENVFGDFNNATYADETGKVVARMTHD